MHMHRRNEATRSAILRRVLLYGITFFTLSILQCSFFTELSFIKATPNLVLGALVAVSIFDKREASIITAISAGFLVDAIGGSGLSLTPIFFLAVSVIFSELSKKILPNIFTYGVLMLPASLTGAVFTYTMMKLNGTSLGLAELIRTILIPEIFVTVILSLPLCFPIGAISKFADSKSKFKL